MPPPAQAYTINMTALNDPTICPDVPLSAPISWKVIVQSWKSVGGTKADCPSAMIVISGEEGGNCNETHAYNPQTGGVLQSYLTTNPVCPNPYTNVCCGFATVLSNYLYSQTPYGIGCLGQFNPSNFAVPLYVTNDHAGMGLNQTQPNFIGPFCHVGGRTAPGAASLQTGGDGTAYGGGQGWIGAGPQRGEGPGQLFPFPWYYYGWMVASFNTSCDMSNIDGASNPCFCAQMTSGQTMDPVLASCYTTNIVQQAVTIAEAICNSNWQ